MKKCIFLVIALMMMSSSCKETQPTKTTTLADFTAFSRCPTALKGQVKSVQYRTYWAKEIDGKIEKGEIITRPERDSLNFMSDWNVIFNEDGLLTKTEYITYDGQINHWDLEILDNKFVNATWNYLGEPRYYWTFSYDDQGNMIERNRYRTGIDTLLVRQVATFYENGLRKELIGYDANKKQIGRSMWIWNDSEQVTEFHFYDSSNELTYTLKVSYDENGILETMLFEYANGGVVKFVFKDFILDNMGNLESSVTYRNDELFSVNERNIEYY